MEAAMPMLLEFASKNPKLVEQGLGFASKFLGSGGGGGMSGMSGMMGMMGMGGGGAAPHGAPAPQPQQQHQQQPQLRPIAAEPQALPPPPPGYYYDYSGAPAAGGRLCIRSVRKGGRRRARTYMLW